MSNLRRIINELVAEMSARGLSRYSTISLGVLESQLRLDQLSDILGVAKRATVYPEQGYAIDIVRVQEGRYEVSAQGPTRDLTPEEMAEWRIGSAAAAADDFDKITGGGGQ